MMDWFDTSPSTVDLVQQAAMLIGTTGADPLADHMGEIGFDVTTVETPEDAVAALGEVRSGIAILGICESVSEPARGAFCDWVRHHHPELPVVVFDPNGGGVGLLSDHDMGHAPLDGPLQHILWRYHYPEWLVRQMESYVVDTLAEGFERSSTPVQLAIKANRVRHCGSVAVLHLSGPSVGGSITVSAATDVLDGLARGLSLPGVSPAERAVDLAGEIVNQFAGRFKADLARRGVDVRLGVPVLIEGRDILIRGCEGRPGLLFEVMTEFGSVGVELRLGTRIPDDDARVTVDLALDGGEFELF